MFSRPFPRSISILKKPPKTKKPTCPGTCSELRQVQRPLSGTSHSLQIPESPRSHQGRRGQATRRTGDVSQCALLRSVEHADWLWSAGPDGGREEDLAPPWPPARGFCLPMRVCPLCEALLWALPTPSPPLTCSPKCPLSRAGLGPPPAGPSLHQPL